VQARLLADHGIIKPIVAATEPGIKGHAFSRIDLDAFLGRLLADAVPIPTPRHPMHDIPKVSRLANCGAMEIVGAILDGRLRRVGRRPDTAGYLSVLVDADEVKRLVRGMPDGTMSTLEVERELRTSFFVVKALIANLPRRPADRAVRLDPDRQPRDAAVRHGVHGARAQATVAAGCRVPGEMGEVHPPPDRKV
jgi:hypothetical protein